MIESDTWKYTPILRDGKDNTWDNSKIKSEKNGFLIITWETENNSMYNG